MAILLAVMIGLVSAQMFVATGRDTLRGLPGVEVVVEALQPEIEGHGLSSAGIQADVGRRLRANGIRVFASQQENPSPAKAYLYVHLNALALPGEAAYAAAVQVQVRQTVRSLASESNIVDAMTWDAHDVFHVPSANLAQLGAEIEGFVDLFVEDWTAVH